MTVTNILFTTTTSEELNSIFADKGYNKIAVLVDENTLTHCYPLLQDDLPPHDLIEIKSGEVNKTLNTCTAIWAELTRLHYDRKSVFVNLGGGVIGDMGGFCASTYKRGIDFINVPTTLLSQVDASVGGKLGVDFNGYKNHIGLFKDPQTVIIDHQFLNTLPENEMRSGYAEIIKHHLIADKNGWKRLITHDFPALPWKELVPYSVTIKSGIVKADPFEEGKRKILNFGHTIGHAIESYLLNQNRTILHGEAVAVGMICESYLSLRKEFITSEDHEIIVAYLADIYGKITLKQEDITPICQYLLQDKKNRNNSIMTVLLHQVGNAIWDIEISQNDAAEAISYYVNL